MMLCMMYPHLSLSLTVLKSMLLRLYSAVEPGLDAVFVRVAVYAKIPFLPSLLRPLNRIILYLCCN